MESLPKMIAGVLALAGFAAACVAGVAAGAEAAAVLWRALGALLACALVGFALGKAADAVVREYVASYREANPLQRRAPSAGPGPGQAAEPAQAA